MKVADTSVLIAAFATWHPAHDLVVSSLTSEVVAAEHALLETYSVLTRLPPPHRIPADVAATWLDHRFGRTPVRPVPGTVASLPRRAAELGISGGAVSDALIGLTAKDAGAMLFTRDQRASRTYDLFGVDYTMLATA